MSLSVRTSILAASLFLLLVETPASDEAPHERVYAGVDGVTEPIKLSHVPPKYPKRPRLQRLEGIVALEAVIRKNGSVTQLKTLECKTRKARQEGAEYSVSPRKRCRPFEISAKKAVREWKYEPSRKDGVPVDVHFEVVIDFNLN